MAITQLSAFLENRPGTLYQAVSAISDAGVNIRALSVADTRDFGILRLIVSDVEKTKEVLSDNVVITQTKVIAARMSDEAGALKKILKVIQDTGVNIEYVYAFTSSVAGSNGLVPAPAAGDEGKVLHGDGTWNDTTAKLVEMSYGESNAWAKFIAAYDAGSIVYCRASSNANPATGSQTRKAFMAYVNNATTPTSVEFQYVRSQSSKTASQQCDQVFVYKLTNASGGTWTVESRNMGPKIVAGTGMSSTFTTGANATITLNAEPNYSASEVDTKVKWVDGKTIYRKTIHTGTLPNSGNIQVAHGISYSSIIKVEGIAQGNSSLSYTSFSLPFSGSVVNSASFIQIWVDTTNITISTGSDRSAYDSYVTLYYTKSS